MSSQTWDDLKGTPGLAGGQGSDPSLGPAYLYFLDPPASGDHREGEKECVKKRRGEAVKEKDLTEFEELI